MEKHIESIHFPHVIHQTYKTTQLPPEWAQTPSSWKQQNPSFTYMFWTDKDIEVFTQRYFPQYVDMMRGFPYTIQRIDTVRYMWMYVYGGIYVDLDLQCMKPILPLLEFYEKVFPSTQVLLVMASNGLNSSSSHPDLTNAVLVSKPRAPFWLEVLKYIRAMTCELPWYKRILKYSHVMYSTGPGALSDVYARLECGQKSHVQLIPHQFLSACSMCDAKPCYNRLSFVRVVQGSSWHNWEGGIIRYFYCVKRSTWMWIIALTIMGLICLFLFHKIKLVQCERRCPRI